MQNRQIIALGGGFSTEDSPLLDDYILRVCGKKQPKICFIPTACGDADSYVIKFKHVITISIATNALINRA